MIDAAQIRRCSGAPRARHSNLRTSILPPPPARHPNSRISNRGPLRLETHLTHTKQTTDPHSNRESYAYFSDLNRLTCGRDPRFSNREPLRLETRLTHTK